MLYKTYLLWFNKENLNPYILKTLNTFISFIAQGVIIRMIILFIIVTAAHVASILFVESHLLVVLLHLMVFPAGWMVTRDFLRYIHIPKFANQESRKKGIIAMIQRTIYGIFLIAMLCWHIAMCVLTFSSFFLILSEQEQLMGYASCAMAGLFSFLFLFSEAMQFYLQQKDPYFRPLSW